MLIVWARLPWSTVDPETSPIVFEDLDGARSASVVTPKCSAMAWSVSDFGTAPFFHLVGSEEDHPRSFAS